MATRITWATSNFTLLPSVCVWGGSPQSGARLQEKMKIERRVDAAGPPAKPQAAFLTLPALPNARVSVVLLQWCFPLPVTRLHGLRHIRQTEEGAAQADAKHRSDLP